jgi:hypothetical protein
MIKDALQYLIGLGNTRTFEIGGRTLATDKLYPVVPPTPEAIKVHSLSGLVGYIKSQFDNTESYNYEKLMVHVVNPITVVAFDPLDEEAQRATYIAASAMVPEFRFGNWYDSEEFIIKLQAGYGVTDDLKTILKVVGNIKEENVANYGDDGVSQQVTAKTGVATVGNIKVPNPVILKPYRTFIEVEQPESAFVFRLQNGPRCALFEADGGAWKIAAMARIRDYLKNELGNMETVSIIA